MLDLLDDLGYGLADPPGRLDEGEDEQPDDDPPLVLLDEVQEGLDLVLEDLPAHPEHDQLEDDADGDQREERPRRHAPVAHHEAHDVAAGHQHHERPARPVDPRWIQRIVAGSSPT